MENIQSSEGKNFTPILQLRQDNIVAVPIERYEHLIDCETRLQILIEERKYEIAQEGSTYVRSEDHILGDAVMHAHWLKKPNEQDAEKEG
jgi:hypothetical protein